MNELGSKNNIFHEVSHVCSWCHVVNEQVLRDVNHEEHTVYNILLNTVSSRIYTQSVSSEIRENEGVGVIVSLDSH